MAQSCKSIFVLCALLMAAGPAIGASDTTSKDGPVQGYAYRLDLQDVVKQIVPAGIDVKIGDDVEKHAPVTWKCVPSCSSWQETLADVMAKNGATVSFAAGAVQIGHMDVQAQDASVRGLFGPRLSSWEIRGAAAGRAWLMAPGGEALGIEEIQVGKSYPVLGVVSRIFQDGPMWYVQTSHGWIAGQGGSQ